jgi:hypothetical protein
MAVHVQGRAEFTGLNGEDWRIDIIHMAGAATNAVEFFVGGDGFVLNYDNASEFDECPTIMGSSVSFTMMYDPDDRAHFTALFDDFNADQEGEWGVAIYKDPDGANTLFWVGTILPEGIAVEDMSPHEQVSITAVDGLAQLDGIDFNNNGTPYEGEAVITDILHTALKKVPHTDYWSGTDAFLYVVDDFIASNYAGYSPPVTSPHLQLTLARISHQTWHNVDNDGELQYFSAKEVIESLCKTFNSSVFMHEGKYWFFPLGIKQAASSVNVYAMRYSGAFLGYVSTTFGKTFGGNTGNFYKRRGWLRTAAPPYKEVKLTRNYQGDKPVVLRSNYTSANIAASLVLDDEDATYAQDTRFKISGNVLYRHTGIPTGTTPANHYGRIVLKINLRLGDGDGSTDYYLKRNYSIGTTTFIYGSTSGYLNDFPDNLELGADAYDAVSWSTTDTDHCYIVCPFIIDRIEGTQATLIDAEFVNYRFDIVTAPLPAAREGLQMFLNVFGIESDGTVTTDFTNTTYATYSVRNLKCAVFDDDQAQEFGTVDITSTGDQGRFEQDLGETLVGDRITSMDHGVIKVFDGSSYVDATDWRSLNSTTASLSINKLATRERMAFHRTGKRMERGQLLGTGNGYLAPYTILTNTEDSREYYITMLRYIASDDEYDVTLINAGRDTTGITAVQDNARPSKDVTPPDAGNVPQPALLGASANNIVNTSYVSYNPLARSRFATTWTSVIGTETLEGYWTITNDGVGKYIEHQGEIPTAGYVLQRAVYVLSKGQGSASDTYTQPAAVQPIVGDSLNTTLALIQEYMNRVGTDSSYTFLITYKETQNLLLDIHTGAAAAYSLRKLDKDYTGYAIRVRESAGNTLADIGFDSNGDLDTTALLSHTGVASGYVHTWYDQSGNGNNAVQSTNASQPQIVSSGSVITENGRPAIQTDGSNDTLALASTISFTDLTWFTVTKKNDTDATGSIIFYGGADYIYGGDDVDNNGNPFLKVSSALIGNTLNNTSASGGEINQHLSYYNRNGTNASGGLNGEVNTEATVVTTAFDLIDLFKYGYSSYYYEGLVQELVLYDSSKKSDRTGIESNINTHYAIGNFATPSGGLLGTYTGAAAAYSLRKLHNAAQFAIMVRRASDDKMKAIGFTASGDLDVTTLEDFCSGTNGYVYTWYDQSGNNNNAVQSTNANQPQIVSSGSVILENGLPAVQFDGSNDYITKAFTLTNPVSHFVVGQGDFAKFIIDGYGSGNLNSLFFDSLNSVRLYNLGGIYQTYTHGTQAVFSSISNASSSSLAVNGNNATGNIGTQNMNGVTMGTVGNLNTYYCMSGTIQEVILYASDEASNRTGIESNINDFYSIY